MSNKGKENILKENANSNLTTKISSATTTKFRIKRQGFKYNTHLKVFPLQQHAFDFFDDIMNKTHESIRELRKDDKSSCLGIKRSLCFSLEPKLFAYEYNLQGKRRYIVAHLGRFIQDYWIDTHAANRNHYELIREGTPCRLYFGENKKRYYYFIRNYLQFAFAIIF